MTIRSSLEAEAVIASNDNRYVLFPNYYKKYLNQLWVFVIMVFIPFVVGYSLLVELEWWTPLYRLLISITFSILGLLIFFIRTRLQKPLSEKWMLVFEDHLEIWTLNGLEIILSKDEIKSAKISWGPDPDQPLPAIEIIGKRIGRMSIGINTSNIYWPYFKRHIRATDYLIGDRFQWDNMLQSLNIY
jgi:hypothetical protein